MSDYSTKYILCICLLLFTGFFMPLSAQWQRMPWPGFDITQEYLRGTTGFLQTNNRFFACTSDGLYISSDNGDTWKKAGGFTPGFKSATITETSEGLFLYGTESPTNFPGKGYFNADKTGNQWVPTPEMPTSHSFFRLGNRWFVLFLSGNSVSSQYSDDNGASWQWLPDAPGVTSNISRLTWHHDTLYVNYVSDRRLYRSTDFGNTYQLISSFLARGLQKGDGWMAAQLLSGTSSSPAVVDSLMYSTNNGVTWQKKKVPFLTPGSLMLLYKYGNELYVQPALAGYCPVYKFDFNTGNFTLFTTQGAPYNANDQTVRFGGITDNCYIGLYQDTIYRVCNGVRTNLTNPGGAIALKEMIAAGSSDLLVLSSSGAANTAYRANAVPGTPVALAPVDKTAYFTQSAYTWYQDTVYSAALSTENYTAKYHVPSQNRTIEMVFDNGRVIDEVYRTNTHLIARSYDDVRFRPLQGSVWQSFKIFNLQLTVAPEYMYYLWNEDGKLYRIGASGAPELLNIPGLVLYPGSNPKISAHGETVILMIHDANNPNFWETLYFSSDYGQTFQSVDMTPIANKDIFHSIRYLDGHLYALTYLDGIYVYDLASDTWSPYNTGLQEQPNSLVVFQGSLLATGPNSGLYKRSTQPVYQLKGTVFLDVNTNGIRDAGEPPVPGIGVSASESNSIFFTRPDGSFTSATDLPIDTHRVILPNAYLQTQPAFAVTSNSDVQSDFALQVPGNQHDLSVSCAANSVFRPGFETPLNIQISNSLLPAANVRLTVTLPAPHLTFVSSVPAPASVVGDTLVIWNPVDLGLFASDQIQLQVKTDQNTPLGKILTVTAEVNSDEDDVNLIDNQSVTNYEVVGSFDPNDKLVNRRRIDLEGNPGRERLDYTIRFQNTGTYPTAFVTLLDTLDNLVLDCSTVSLISSSHPCEARLVDDKILKVRFPNLELPPQSESELLSQGYITFSVLTKEPLSAPGVIRNRAGIYFDYNTPVITPYAETIVDFPVATAAQPAYTGMEIYPNPARDEIRISDPLSDHETIVLRLRDARGRLIREEELAPYSRLVELPDTGCSVLFVEIWTSRGVISEKIVRFSE